MTTGTKIVIAAGQEFSVDVSADNEAIRSHLAATFPEVATAEIRQTTRTVDGVEIPVVEFVKKAGTKGLSGAELAARLMLVPRGRLPREGFTRQQADLLSRFMEGKMTVDEALAAENAILAAHEAATGISRPVEEGARLCNVVCSAPAESLDVSW